MRAAGQRYSPGCRRPSPHCRLPARQPESLRPFHALQLCVFKLANDSGRPWLWWDYATKFGEQASGPVRVIGWSAA